jgi:hypothetical protein
MVTVQPSYLIQGLSFLEQRHVLNPGNARRRLAAFLVAFLTRVSRRLRHSIITSRKRI